MSNDSAGDPSNVVPALLDDLLQGVVQPQVSLTKMLLYLLLDFFYHNNLRRQTSGIRMKYTGNNY